MQSFHFRSVQSIPTDEVHSSLALGFYCDDYNEFGALCTALVQPTDHPQLVHVADVRVLDDDDGSLGVESGSSTPNGSGSDDDGDDRSEED